MSPISRRPLAKRGHLDTARLLVGSLTAVVLPFLCAADTQRRSMSLEERVAAQRAIEQVYWNHRIWPKENKTPKPPLSVVLSEAAIRARVEDTLRKSNALERYWHHPITAEQLQAELNRMAAHTRDPQVLKELFAALGNDPFLIAETLARQTLADRLIRNWYASDTRFHEEPKKKAEAAQAACRSVECMPSMGGDYRETTLQMRALASAIAESRIQRDVVRLDGEGWKSQIARLMERFGGRESLPLQKLSALVETPDAFIVTAVLSQSKDEVKTATVTWPKHSFDEWWPKERRSIGTHVESGSKAFMLPLTPSSGCAADTWTPTSTDANVPAARRQPTAVWTGSEMIVWGGDYIDGIQIFLNSGARYNPSTDTWTPTSTGANLPLPRFGHTAVWTGTEMIVWGGYGDGAYLDTGGRYDPTTDTWMPTSTGANVPSARGAPTAVWTGTEMILWGGGLASCHIDCCDDLCSDLCEICENVYENTGGRYAPSTDTWAPTSTGANVPSARDAHTAVWTGTEMIVWGGDGGALLNTGGRYDPSTDEWTPTSVANVPTASWDPTAVWTGTEMIVWGGYGDVGYLNTGGRYDPSTDKWTPTSTGANVPDARDYHTAIWTGQEMIVWGGFSEQGGPSFSLSTGGRYDPSADSWAQTSTGANVPAARLQHTAIWTGKEMIVWGGYSWDTSQTFEDGGLYCACSSITPYYLDADGDGYGDPAVVGTSCDGTIPAGYVANQSDCNDASASVSPAAVELCNGVDDNCDGTIDNVAPPGPFDSLTVRSDSSAVEWTAVAAAQTYDVVYGDLGVLQSSGGDFTPAIIGCTAYHATSTSAGFAIDPDLGQAFWVLVRGDNCAGAGTYDSGDPAQVGSSDAEIEASPRSCSQPPVCGDRICNGNEDCFRCPYDCGPCASPVCGDYVCNGTEDCQTCQFDCGVCPCVTDDDCQPATCCQATSCIPVWVPQGCGVEFCQDPGYITCLCQNGACIGVF